MLSSLCSHFAMFTACWNAAWMLTIGWDWSRCLVDVSCSPIKTAGAPLLQDRKARAHDVAVQDERLNSIDGRVL